MAYLSKTFRMEYWHILLKFSKKIHVIADNGSQSEKYLLLIH